YQEMCLYLWTRFGEGVPIGMNEAYIIKGCEFHLLNFLRKGRKHVWMQSLDEPITEDGSTLKDIIPDIRNYVDALAETHLSIDDIKASGLTKKEQDVLSLLLKGYTSREIAGQLGISHVMVLKYKKKIIKKCRR
ncbi:MAG: hypothetical protein JW800_06075, partial [Candidatus Omnitrophica bacterium]|nr:hypothetical protein [Candidatus Omnitrophota bacterium]